jgi:hypothetical protein
MAQPKGRSAVTSSVPAPIGGWNARDSLAQMSPLDAVILNNFYPTPTDVQLRLGWSQSSLLTTTTTANTISSITFVDTLATLTTATVHGLTTGNQVVISGASPSAYNGTYAVTVTSTTAFTYVMASTPATNATTVGTYAVQITTQVNSLMNYAGASVQTLFAASGTIIYNANSALATESLTNLSNDKFQYVNTSTPGGNFLSAVNGADPALIYNGTNWLKVANTDSNYAISSITRVGTLATLTTAASHGLSTGNQVTITGASPAAYNGTYIITVTGLATFTYVMATTPASSATTVGSYAVQLYITGVNSANLIHVNLFKNRLFYTQKDSLKVWYLPVNAIGGAAEQLDFGGIARNGGYIQAMATWTLDAGQGADDYAVFITNMGEVIVYNGTDPADAATWALKGVWQLGYVYNRRCFFKWSGDVLLLTQDGLVPLASALQSSRLDPRINLTDKIFYAISQAASLYSGNFGWQVMYFASPNMLLINVPTNAGTQQFVMHTITKSWGQFTGINANCFEMNGDQLYFGGLGLVGKYFDGYSDNGTNINASVQQAYSYFDAPGQLKRFTLVRPILQTDNGAPSVLCGINVDFDYQNQLGTVTFNPSATSLGVWDGAIWDTSSWGGNLSLNKIWQSVSGLGFSGGMNMSMASQGIDVHWASTDYVMEKGGIL